MLVQRGADVPVRRVSPAIVPQRFSEENLYRISAEAPEMSGKSGGNGDARVWNESMTDPTSGTTRAPGGKSTGSIT